ncbi:MULTISPECIES: hypothetical protein [Pantoea]|uniref:hypothetical protein n=1 Tax=Pantoea TaxID=53335 RepID=UPI00197FAA99|nr:MULTISPECIES: hypothetical protein [Pantoea]
MNAPHMAGKWWMILIIPSAAASGVKSGFARMRTGMTTIMTAMKAVKNMRGLRNNGFRRYIHAKGTNLSMYIKEQKKADKPLPTLSDRSRLLTANGTVLMKMRIDRYLRNVLTWFGPATAIDHCPGILASGARRQAL